MFEQRFIVQELESYEFICPDVFGDLAFTPNIKQAGQYETFEDAFTAATEELGCEFAIFSFYVRTDKS